MFDFRSVRFEALSFRPGLAQKPSLVLFLLPGPTPPFNDLQGDIRDLAWTNVFKTQLEIGEFAVMTFQAAVQDSGVIEVSLEDGEEDEEMTEGMRDDDLEMAEDYDTKYHVNVATQKECLSPMLPR